jgi:hypothetical protein
MKNYCYSPVRRYLILLLVAAGALAFCSTTAAAETMAAEDPPNFGSIAGSSSGSTAGSNPDEAPPGTVGLHVVGASAGITTDYFEQVITDALVASEIFSSIDNSQTAETVLPMIRAKGVFPGTVEIDRTPYFLEARIVKLDTPSFSVYMTVGMNVIWTLYRTADKTELLHEKIYSTYTGGMFEGGIHGANRVRVASEGATRENVRIGVEMLAALDLDQQEPETEIEPEPVASEQD